jgi:SAM-dependent methyltransferase
MDIKIQDERGYNQLFADVGSSPFRAERRHSWFIAQAKRKNAKRILEIGCGTGEAAAAVAAGTEAEVVGIDISDIFLERARQTHKAANLRFEKLDLFAESPDKFGTFDFVFGNGILHHLVVQLDQILKILREITTQSGGMAFIEPNFMNPYCAFIFGTKAGRKWALLEPDEMAFRASKLRSVISKSGWHNVQLQTRDFLVPGLPVQLIRPIIAVEPFLESTALTRWLAQSHFVTADASAGLAEPSVK